MALMEQINDLRAQRRARVDEARALLDAAEAANRNLTAEEEEQYGRINAAIDDLGARAERLEQQMDREARYAAPDHLPQRPDPEQRDGDTASPFSSAEYRSGFWSYVRRSISGLLPQEHRAMSVGVDADGGYAVPDEFQRELIEALTEQNVMRQLGTTMTTGSGTSTIPVVIDRGVATWTGEGVAYTESDDEFDVATLGAHKLARIMKASEELVNDFAFDLQAHLAESFRRSFGDAEEAAMVNGNGTAKPRGVLLDASVGKTTVTNSAITADEIIDGYHSLPRPYRPRARWMMNDATALVLRKLKDSSNQYLWQPGLQAGQPDVLLGRPVVYSGSMPTIATTAKVIAFGDFSYYRIADRQQIALQRLVELYAANGQVGFRMFTRLDGRLMLAEAVKVIQMAV